MTVVSARPRRAARQIDALTIHIAAALEDALAGCLLHGSLAMTGFDEARSDIDVLVVLHRPLTAHERDALGARLLEISGTPHPVELSAVTATALQTWRHPCAHEFHFGEEHRERFARGDCAPSSACDADLALHVTVARARGIDLLGVWPATRLPRVPEADFLDAARADFEWAARQPGGAIAYRRANACRTLAWREERRVLSKSEGIAWCAAQGISASEALARVESWLRASSP